MPPIQPLKENWRVDEDSSIHPVDQIKERVRSESWYTSCKGYPNIREEDVTGKLGKPIE